MSTISISLSALLSRFSSISGMRKGWTLLDHLWSLTKVPNLIGSKSKIKKKEAKKSPVPVKKVFHRILSDLKATKAHDKPSIFSRLNFVNVPDQIFSRSPLPTRQAWAPKATVHAQGDEQGDNLAFNQDANFLFPIQNAKRSFAQVVMNNNFVLTGENSVPIGPDQPMQPVPLLHNSQSGFGPCTRCLSRSHNRALCKNRIKCTSCFRLGHIASLCRFLPRFPGLSQNPVFSNQIKFTLWSHFNIDGWFALARTMTGGDTPRLAPLFSSPSSFLARASTLA